jgi:hypothetical protein
MQYCASELHANWDLNSRPLHKISTNFRKLAVSLFPFRTELIRSIHRNFLNQQIRTSPIVLCNKPPLLLDTSKCRTLCRRIKSISKINICFHIWLYWPGISRRHSSTRLVTIFTLFDATKRRGLEVACCFSFWSTNLLFFCFDHKRVQTTYRPFLFFTQQQNGIFFFFRWFSHSRPFIDYVPNFLSTFWQTHHKENGISLVPAVSIIRIFNCGLL